MSSSNHAINARSRSSEVTLGRQTVPGRRTIIQGWVESFRAAPLFGLALVFYMGLPSSVIFSEDGANMLSAWHPAYPGWYDLVYLSLAAGGFTLSRLRLPSGAVLICGFLLLSILISIGFSGTYPTLASAAFFDPLLYWLRFSLTFVCVTAITEKHGTRTTSDILFVVGLVLMASSVFVFRLQYPEFNRVYASGMTVGSFGQVLLILSLVAMLGNNLGMMLISLAFLILTFSRTDLLLWVGSLLYFLFTRSKMRLGRRGLYGVLVLLLFVSSTFILLRYPEFRFVIYDRLDLADIFTMNRRTDVWQYGIDLLMSRSVPLFGIGFNCSPSVLLDFTSLPSDEANRVFSFPSFHSIVFEYAIGLGVLSVPIFAVLFWRIRKAWRSKSHVSFYIYTLFVLSQSFDFCFYRPKEVIIWAAFLGLAEGEMARQRKRTQTLSRSFASNPSPLAPGRGEEATLS